MTVPAGLDAAGRRRSPATMPGYHAGRPPRNKGRLYPADPPAVEEIVAVMREASDDPHGYRFRALVVVLWRGGLRVAEALSLGERGLDQGAARCSCATARAAGAARSAWTPGAGSSCARGSPPASSSRSGRCSASSTARPADGLGRAPTRASSFAGSPPKRASGATSRRTSCATRMRSSSPARERSTSSSANTPISARPRSICRASTPRRSSLRCARAARR